MNPDLLIAKLIAVLGSEAVIFRAIERQANPSALDAMEQSAPLCTVQPSTTEQVASVVRLCNQAKVIYAPGGAGGDDARGTLLTGGVLVNIASMNRILSIDVRNRRLAAQVGVTNVALSQAMAGDAPEPSPQDVSALDGSSAGRQMLNDSLVASRPLEITVVMPDGEIARFGAVTEDSGGYDLVGLFCGAESTLGIVTEANVRTDGSMFQEHVLEAEQHGLMSDTPPAETLEVLQALHNAFNPEGLCNPGKLVPMLYGSSFDAAAHGDGASFV